MRELFAKLQRPLDDARGAIGVLGAFVLVGVNGVSALALEFKQGLLQRVESRRGRRFTQAFEPAFARAAARGSRASPMRIFRQIARDGRAAVAPEFAFVGPIFLLLLLVIIELGLTLTTQSVLDGAARDAARLIRTGQVQSQSSPITTFQTLLCSQMSPLISVSTCDSKVIFDVQVFGNFGSVSFSPCTYNNNQTGTGTQCQFSAGNSGQIVGVRVTYTRSFIVPWVGACLSGGSCWTGPGSAGGSNPGTGGITLTSTVIFQNEPFT
jgi:Flp pilus assembly protein TadG